MKTPQIICASSCFYSVVPGIRGRSARTCIGVEARGYVVVFPYVATGDSQMICGVFITVPFPFWVFCLIGGLSSPA